GSFGLTGCHTRNLMNAGQCALLEGARFAFVQGGDGGFRLVYLTSPVSVHKHDNVVEVRWDSTVMPFRYWRGRGVLRTHGHSDVAGFKAFIAGVKRNGWVGRFASRFRSRREPLPADLSAGVIELFARISVQPEAAQRVAGEYADALPYLPPKVDHDRRTTYRRLLEKADAAL